MTKVDEIAEKLRQEPFHVFPMRYNCIGKSFRFKEECRKAGIDARVVICLGIVEMRRFGCSIKLPWGHEWGEVGNERIEVARPLDQRSPWGTFDIDFKPVIAIWI